MTMSAVARLADLVTDIHQRHRDPGRLTVVPVVLVASNSGPSDVTALGLGIGDSDGNMIVASDNAQGTRGVLHPDLLQFVNEVLVKHGRTDLQISAVEGGVVASTTDGVTAATASEGQRVLLGVLASLFDERLHGSELAVLVYDESEFDEATAELVWDLCARRLGKVTWPNLQTLVVVARAGRVVPSRHFANKNSARYVLNGDELDIRRSWETDETDLDRISQDDGPLVLFIAAGFSASSKTKDDQPLAMGNELRDRALARLLHRVGGGDGDELSKRYLRYCKDRDALLPGEKQMTESTFAAGLTLERVLVDELKDPPDELGPTLEEFHREVTEALDRPGWAVTKLRELIEISDRRIVLITVNLDNLIEHHCGDLVETFVTAKEFENAAQRIDEYWQDGGRVPLLKLHGTLEQPETLVASIHSVELGLSDSKIEAIDAALLGRDNARTTLCYIGSSMRDRDLNQLLGLRRYAERLDEWWVAPTVVHSVREFIETYRHRRWRHTGVPSQPEAHCITRVADDFLGSLASNTKKRPETPPAAR